MKHLLLTTALVTATAAGAYAQSNTATDAPATAATDTQAGAQSGVMSGDMFRAESTPDEMRASDFIGMRVFAAAEGAAEDAYDSAQDNWEDVGEINDVILNREGEVQAVLVDIGGFLGIGERQVAVQMDALDFVSDSSTAENEGDFFLVLTADRAALEGAPAYGSAADQSMTDQTASTDQTMQPAAEGTTDTAATDTAAQPAAEGTTGMAATDTTAQPAAEGTDTAATESTATEETNSVEQTAENAAEETEEAVEETADAAGDAASEAGQEVTETAEAAGESMENATDNANDTDTAVVTAPDANADATATATADAGNTDATTAQPMNTATGAGAMGDFSREGFAEAGTDYLTTENLTGARVYDTNDKWVGEISELLIDDQGKITEAIVDVGGFLGIGEKPVALQLSDLKIMRQQEGDEVRIYTAMAEEELENMPEFEK